MSRYHSYLQSATIIIKQYRADVPLNVYLKSYFSKDKKFGSRDRKIISSLCYYYFRLGHGENYMTIEERILAGLFLCESSSNPLLDVLKPGWNNEITLPLQEKLFRFEKFYPANIFPWADELSDGIEAGPFSLSFLIQPKLFLRIRPGKEWTVLKKLEEEQVPYYSVSENCLAFDNGSKLQEVLDINKDVVVQDYNSQRVGEYMADAFDNVECPVCKVWDCCAASGGKSIMAYDLKPSIELTVSDVRPSILHNLQQRFQLAGIRNYRSFLADLRNVKELTSDIGEKEYDVIICDAPCSGSGTWARTPEQLYFFKQAEIERYANLQKSIVQNAVPRLKKGGQLLYITCSVFKKENEEVVEFISKHCGLTLSKMEVLKGYSMQADTMFVALFEK